MRKSAIILVFFILPSCMGEKNNHSGSSSPKASVSFRIGVTQWLPEKRFNELLALFDKNKGVTDELTFFTSATHAPLPLDVNRERMGILRERMATARQHGYSTGINILTTIGHHNENLENSIGDDYPCMTNIDGELCHGSHCPNNSMMRKYVAELYELAAEARPDYIWIDDDVRFGHMPIGNGCFCDSCLRIFASEYGKSYTREELKKAFNTGSTGDKLRIRRQWLQHNRNTISRLFELIEQSVHKRDTSIVLGFMTGDRFFEGYDFDNWASILSGKVNTGVMWRPGGGYYTDISTNDLAGKSHDIGRQVSWLPPSVTKIESEIECFPYQRLKKAENIIVLEAASHIAAGCTGAAFNVLSMYDEPLDEFHPLVAKLREARPFFDLLAGSLGRLPLTGISALWNKESFASVNAGEGNWTSAGSPVVTHDLYNIGLPASYSAGAASVVLLGKDNILVYSDAEIRKILSGGVYMDAGALQQLNDMGYGDLTGFRVTGSSQHDRIEKFTSDSLNGTFAGRERDNRQSFWNSPAFSLEQAAAGARILSYLVDYSGREVSPATSGVFENSLGGRICVSGYYPWSFMENLSKSTQMKSVFRWLSKDSLAGYVSSFHRINIWIREKKDGSLAAAFTNSSFDTAKDIELMLRTEKNEVRVYDMKCKMIIIKSSGREGQYRKFVIPCTAPWEMRLVLAE